MSLTSILFNNPISFVITNDNYYATKGILLQTERNNILYVVKDTNEVILLTKFLKIQDSKIIHKNEDFSSLKKYNFITYKLYKEYLIERKERYDIFDQVFIPINETKNVDLFLIIKIINQLRKDKNNISNICYILRNDSIEASYELKITKSNTYTHNNKVNKVINYSPQTDIRKGDKNINFVIIEDINKLDVDNGKNILVILNNTKDVQHMYYNMSKKLDTKKFFISSIYTTLDKLNYVDRRDDQKTMIYIISSDLTMRINLPDIGYIFDSFVYSNSNNQVFYNSKDRANKYVNYFSPSIIEEEDEKFYLTRYTSLEFFEKSYAYDVPSLHPNLFYHNFLLLIDNSYDPIAIFKKFIDASNINNIYTTLNNLKILNENKIIIDYKNLFSFNLYLRPSLLIMKAIENNEPVYPFIVLATIINYAEDGMFKSRVESNSGMLKTYLDIFLKYSKEIKNINPDNEELKNWCNENNVILNVMQNILNSIKHICHIIALKQKIVLGLFDSNNLIQKAIPHLLDIYVGFVFKQVNKHMHHYSNEITVVKIANSESDYPDNVISFKSVKPGYKNKEKSSMDTIVYYLGFNIS